MLSMAKIRKRHTLDLPWGVRKRHQGGIEGMTMRKERLVENGSVVCKWQPLVRMPVGAYLSFGFESAKWACGAPVVLWHCGTHSYVLISIPMPR